jgi:hypothetical protein
MTPAQHRCGRFYAESLIEQAISILNTIDGDADLEDGGDGEPSLAALLAGKGGVSYEAAPCLSEPAFESAVLKSYRWRRA